MKKLFLLTLFLCAYLMNYAQFTFKDGGGTVDVYANGTLKTSFQKAGLTITYAGDVMTLRQDTKRAFTYNLDEIDTPIYSTMDSVVSEIASWLGTFEVSYINVADSIGIKNNYITDFTYLDSITSNIGNVVTGVPNAYLDTISASYLIINNDSIDYRNAAAKFHRIDSLDISTANTWITVKMDTLVGDETTYGFKFNTDSSKIICTKAGLMSVQGCVHYTFYGGSTTLAKLYTRVLIDGVEARCLQTNTNKNRFASATGFQSFVGTVRASVGSTIELQIQTDNTDLDLEGDPIFDNPVSATIAFTYISK